MRKCGIKSLFLMLCFGVFYGFIGGVDAASLDFGTPTRKENVTTIPVILNVESGDNTKEIRLGCATDNTDVECKVESANASSVTGTADANQSTWIFRYVDPVDENKGFDTGKTVIANFVLTNATNMKLNEVKVSFKNTTIDKTSFSGEVKTFINSKPEEKPKSSDARLKDIKISQGVLSPSFDISKFEYVVYGLADTINSIRITPVCNEGNCDFSISGGRGISGTTTVTLNQGENIVKLKITSEKGDAENNYTLKIYRGETGYNSSKLSSLEIDTYTLTPAFSKDVTEYAITVPYQVNGLTSLLKYVAEDANAKINVSGTDNFVVGLNKITIIIDNVLGDGTTTYTINVNRLSEENIEITKYIDDKVTFNDADGIQTTLSLEEFKNQYPKEYQKIINEEYKFDDEGNIVLEEAIKEEEKKTEKKSNKIWLIVLLIIGGLAIIVVSGILIFKKKKPTSDEGKKEEQTEAAINEDEEEINEEGLEEKIIGNNFSDDQDATVDIDVALSDLMNTKQYEFDTKDE